jgi:hypothetical protein
MIVARRGIEEKGFEKLTAAEQNCAHERAWKIHRGLLLHGVGGKGAG